MRLGHINLVVNDLAKSTEFYCNLLSFEVRSRLPGRCVHLTFGGTHHDLSLFQSRPDLRILPNRTIPSTFSSTVGCYRLAFEASNVREFFDVFLRTESSGVELLQAVDYEVSWAFSFYDPDENEVEIFLDRRGKAGGQVTFRGIVRSLSPARLREEALEGDKGVQELHDTVELESSRQKKILSRHGYQP